MNNQKSSMLSVNSADVNTSGSYKCIASISPPESQLVHDTEEITVLIKGPTLPVKPTVIASNSTAISATITWLVTSVAYDLESYQLVYGTEMDPEDNIITVMGEPDVNALNLVYYANIVDLQAFTHYYYKIIAINSYGNTTTEVEIFGTKESIPTAPPELLQVESKDSRSVTLSWQLPEKNGRNGLIIVYVVTCSSQSDDLEIINTTIAANITVEQLNPHSTYSCTVAAVNSIGKGPEANVTFTANSEAPETAPVELSVTKINTSSLLVSWNPPFIPNGVITHYTVYVTFDDGTEPIMFHTTSSATSFIINHLQPYQLVTVQVSGHTDAGEGPKSAEVMGRTSEDDILPPELIIIPEGSKIAGQTFSLLCRVTVPIGAVLTSVKWLDPKNLEIHSGGGISVGDESTFGDFSRLTTYALQFYSILTSQGGSYTCIATISSLHGTIMETDLLSYDIIVQIPTPSIQIAAPNYFYAGSLYVLNCTVQISTSVDTSDIAVAITWSKGDNKISVGDTIEFYVAETNISLVFQSQLQFNPLRMELDDGNYTCAANVSTEPQSPYILPDTGVESNKITVQANVPILEAYITPATVYALDVAPYNTFSLVCFAESPEGNVLLKKFSWFKEDMVINDDGVNTLITDFDIAASNSRSELIRTGDPIQTYEYNCTVSMLVSDVLEITASSIAEVKVKGPSVPVQAVMLREKEITNTSAVLCWNIPYLTYTPEQYVVIYHSSDGVTQMSPDSLISPKDFTATNEDYNITLTDLLPNTLYYYQIRSTNSYGTNVSVERNFTSSETGPSHPPANFKVDVLTSRSLLFSWTPPYKADESGIIISYTLDCQPFTNSLPQTYITSGSYQVEGFSPATQYTCSVYASTSADKGPAAFAVVTTDEDVPGLVTGLTLVALSATSMNVSWNMPLSTNGVIKSYHILVTTSSQDVYNRSISSDHTFVIIENLEKYTLYNVTVRAQNSAGLGEGLTDRIFTEEGVPTVAPKNVNAYRLNATHVNVSWVKLTLEEARGFVTVYRVNIFVLEGYSRQQSSYMTTVDAESSHVVIEVQPSFSYQVRVSASTSAGEGTFSTATDINALESCLFQLLLKGVPDCPEWIFSKTDEKIVDITTQIASKINQICLCSFSDAYISDAIFICTEEVIFRAKLFSTPYVNCKILLTNMKDIAESGTAGVTVDGIRLIIDEGCEIEISSFDDPFCTTLDGTQATGNSTVETAPTTSVPTGDVNYNIIIYTILGTVVIGIIAILVTICVCSRIGHKKKYILSGPQDQHHQANIELQAPPNPYSRVQIHSADNPEYVEVSAGVEETKAVPSPAEGTNKSPDGDSLYENVSCI